MGRRRGILSVVAVAGAVAAVVLLASAAGVFRAFRDRASDGLFPVGDADPSVVVVGIDQRALAETGERWPWPRDLQGRLVSAIAELKPAVIVLDVIYAPATALDAAFVSAVEASGVPVVVGQASSLRPASEGAWFAAREVVAPAAEVAAVTTIGETAMTPDSDAVVRVVPAAVEGSDGTFTPSLALAAVAAFDGVRPQVIVRPGAVQVGERTVRTEGRTQLRVAYTSELAGRDPQSRTVSAADVLAGRTDPQALAGKAVFVGATDPALGDRQDTPVAGGGAPGLFVHVNAFNTMLTATWLTKVSDVETAGWVVVLSLLVAAAVVMGRLWLAMAVPLTLSALYFTIVSLRFDAGTQMDLLYPLLAVLLSFIAGLVVRYIVLSKERRTMLDMLEQYVPRSVARQLLSRRGGALPTGAITFLFTDVVGSTELWERAAKPMADAMRRHDALIESAVEGAGGAVVRPRGEGDSSFCVFIDPTDAARGALAIQRALASERWPTPKSLEVRVGIHTGSAELRAEDYYGSDVNRCARIRSLAAAGEILLSEATARVVRDRMGGEVLLDRGVHLLKGLDAPEHVFQLVSRIAVDVSGG